MTFLFLKSKTTTLSDNNLKLKIKLITFWLNEILSKTLLTKCISKNIFAVLLLILIYNSIVNINIIIVKQY